jgi:hypothetical protein
MVNPFEHGETKRISGLWRYLMEKKEEDIQNIERIMKLLTDPRQGRLVLVGICFIVAYGLYQSYTDGIGFAQTRAFEELKALLTALLVLMAAAYFHEGGHHYLRRYFLPDDKAEFRYVKILFVPIPTVNVHIGGAVLERKKQILVLLAGPLAGLLPILPVYFYDRGIFLETVFLYAALACLMDFLGILVLVIFPKSLRGEE